MRPCGNRRRSWRRPGCSAARSWRVGATRRGERRRSATSPAIGRRRRGSRRIRSSRKRPTSTPNNSGPAGPAPVASDRMLTLPSMPAPAGQASSAPASSGASNSASSPSSAAPGPGTAASGSGTPASGSAGANSSRIAQCAACGRRIFRVRLRHHQLNLLSVQSSRQEWRRHLRLRPADRALCEAGIRRGQRLQNQHHSSRGSGPRRQQPKPTTSLQRSPSHSPRHQRMAPRRPPLRPRNPKRPTRVGTEPACGQAVRRRPGGERTGLPRASARRRAGCRDARACRRPGRTGPPTSSDFVVADRQRDR